MKKFFFFLFLLWPVLSFAGWTSIGPGWDHQKTAEFEAFRMDLAHARIDLLRGEDFGGARTAEGFRKASKATLVINGGFFDENFHSLGLLHRHGKTEQGIRETSWGIFQITGGDFPVASIKHRKDFRPAGVDLALQVGPRLIVDGKIQKFQENGPHRRSGVGITSAGKVIFAVSETPIEMEAWAKILKGECVQALNLDGGSSTQMSVLLDKFSLDVEGFTPVPNALAVFPR